MITDLIKELRTTNSHPEKVAILKRYDNFELRKILVYMYDPNKVYHVTGSHNYNNSISNLTEGDEILLKKLMDQSLTGLAALQAIKNHRNKSGGLIDLILSKDLKCGISIVTINKAFPKLLPSFKLQKAQTLELTKVKFPCYAETKYDGVRLGIIVTYNKVTILTYNGKPVNLTELQNNFSKLPEGVYDGELISASGSSATRTSTSGLVNSAMHGGNIAQGSLVFKVFDSLSLKEMQEERCILNYEARRTRLQAALAQRPFSNIKLVEAYRVTSINEVNAIYSELINKGFEGLILKQPKSLYTFKRSRDWVKLKEVRECDILCYDYEEGTGQYEGAIGSLRCKGVIRGQLNNVGEYKDFEIDVKVSGLTAVLRNKNPAYFLNNIIEVKYNQIIQDETTGNYSLFTPRFKALRFDK